MSSKISQEWLFVITTDQYAGNFEREMCAFITGMVGECGVGDEEAKQYYEQTNLVEVDYNWTGMDVESCCEDFNNPFTNFVTNKYDGCYRPVSINDENSKAMDIFFSQKPKEEMLVLMMNRAEQYVKQRTTKTSIIGFSLLKQETTEIEEFSITFPTPQFFNT